MAVIHQVRLRLGQLGLLPRSHLARFAWFLFGLDAFLFALQKIFAAFAPTFSRGLAAWVTWLSLASIVLFAILAMRWIKARLLWRLRNRLIVTYVFIGVIPVVLLIALTLISFYLFAGQFAAFLVNSRLQAELDSLQSANAAISRNLGDRLQSSPARRAEGPGALAVPTPNHAGWNVYVWLDGAPLMNRGTAMPILPSGLPPSFCGTVRDEDRLFLRASQSAMVAGHKLTVLSSQPLDEPMLRALALPLGELNLRPSGFPGREHDPNQARPLAPPACAGSEAGSGGIKPDTHDRLLPAGMVIPAMAAGENPPAAHWWDTAVNAPTGLFVVDWRTGAEAVPAALFVETRLSTLYARLFESMGDFVNIVEFAMLMIALGLAVIEVAAILIGLGLTRTITSAVALLYTATEHINRGDFSHRIPVKSDDQLAALARSFNSMTDSLEKLIVEQKEKQRMEGELVIAQEVQAQLFPRHIRQLPSLEVFGFCRPARTVSGDYYDFLAVEENKLLLAVGDISGKGIAAALLMATIHSAVRAYCLEGIPILREPVGAGSGVGSSAALGSPFPGVEVSPAAMLTLLNHQLYDSTPAEKYATLFLAIYDGQQRTLTYSNGGHLPPLILGSSRSIRRLDQGGTVVGLFDDKSYDESLVHLSRGEIFLPTVTGSPNRKTSLASSGNSAWSIWFGKIATCPCHGSVSWSRRPWMTGSATPSNLTT